MDASKIVGANVARLRSAKGLSQVQLAARLGPHNLGVTQGYISELEAGRKNPTLSTMVAIANALEVGVEKIVFGLTP